MRPAERDGGFVLAAALVMVFLVLLALTVAAPKIAMSIKRDREVESAHRAQQYVRALRVYSLITKGQSPGSVEALEKTNNRRFLRQKYVDPLTGKDNWRLIHMGENKTKVKGFFGEDLPGLGGGLNAGGSTTGTGGTTATTNPGIGGTSGFGPSSSISAGTSPTAGGTGGTGANAGTGPGSQSVDGLKGGGPIIGVGSSATGEAILVENEQTNYQDWEFLYDPRIEQLYAKGNLLSGASSGGLGSASDLKAPDKSTPP